MPFDERYRPDPVFMQLDEGFHDPVEPAEFPRRTPRFFNEPWASRVGLGGLDAPERERHFARLQPLPDNLPQPLALRYHGHQFGSYNPQRDRSGVQAGRLTLGFARWRSPQAITSDDPHVRGGLSNRNATSMEPTAHRLELPEGPSSFGTKDPHERGGRHLF